MNITYTQNGDYLTAAPFGTFRTKIRKWKKAAL